jgi:choline dehydrogenase-like flavoprotein
MPAYESDLRIIGAGISSAMLAELSELHPGLSITVVEAGRSIFDLNNRYKYRERMINYGENPWPGDFIADQYGENQISRSMAVGGQALHWGGTCNRFSEEDLRLKSMYGRYVDWPMEWAELEKYYCEAERRLGVSGEPSPLPGDKRSQPYPMPPMQLTYSLQKLKDWGDKSGIPFQGTPQSKNTVEGYNGRSICHRCGTCDICPTGANTLLISPSGACSPKKESRCMTRRLFASSCLPTARTRWRRRKPSIAQISRMLNIAQACSQ